MNTIQYNAFFMNEWIKYNMNELINEIIFIFFRMNEYNTI